jgi:hypothetical protein
MDRLLTFLDSAFNNADVKALLCPEYSHLLKFGANPRFGLALAL